MSQPTTTYRPAVGDVVTYSVSAHDTPCDVTEVFAVDRDATIWPRNRDYEGTGILASFANLTKLDVKPYTVVAMRGTDNSDLDFVAVFEGELKPADQDLSGWVATVQAVSPADARYAAQFAADIADAEIAKAFNH